MIILKDTIFLLTRGEYSDYDAITLCKASIDIDIMALRGEYMALHPEQNYDYKFDVYQFVKWIIVDKEICQELDYQEWHLGSYATADFSIGNKSDE